MDYVVSSVMSLIISLVFILGEQALSIAPFCIGLKSDLFTSILPLHHVLDLLHHGGLGENSLGRELAVEYCRYKHNKLAQLGVIEAHVL